MSTHAETLPQFVEISKGAGIDFVHNSGAFGKKYLPETMGSGCGFIDYDNDGWQDILLVNGKDWTGHATGKRKTLGLYRNNHDGTFTDVTKAAGLAIPLYGLGVAVGDYDNDDDDDLYISCLEADRLFQNRGDGTFVDVTQKAGIDNPGFGTSCAWFDYDKDGKLDIFGGNGHVENEINAVQSEVTYAQTPHLFRNLGKGKFEEVVNKVGGDLAKPIVGRGAAYGDIDNDGDWDVLVTTSNGPARLYRNDGGNQNHWIKLKLIGTKSNRDGIGAKITIHSKSGSQTRTIKSGCSYCSQSELSAIFGLGSDSKIDAIEVVWPSGTIDKLGNVKPNQLVVVEEGKK